MTASQDPKPDELARVDAIPRRRRASIAVRVNRVSDTPIGAIGCLVRNLPVPMVSGIRRGDRPLLRRGFIPGVPMAHLGRLLASPAFLLATAVTAQDTRCTASDGSPATIRPATPVRIPPRVDGRSDDDAWNAAPPIRDFCVFTPREGGIPAFASEARIVYDDRALYVLVRAYDPEPDRIVRRLARRDTFDPTADQVLLFLDPLLDRRNGFGWLITAGGVRYDALQYDDGQQDASWDGIWEAAAAVDSAGWVAEFAIPFGQLHLPARDTHTVGIMIGRWVGRTGERASWPQYRRSRPGLASQFGTLTDIRGHLRTPVVQAATYGLAQGQNVAFPTTGVPNPSLAAKAGADIQWHPHPALSIDATVNPDFGQIEADPSILNLTGVELFFPERRPFFLSGAELLAFPLASDGSGQLFFSRRIGRQPVLVAPAPGMAVPGETTILGAARLTARPTPSTAIGALTAFTQREVARDVLGGAKLMIAEPAARFAVLRLQQRFRGGKSGIDLMGTRLDRPAAEATAIPSAAQALAVKLHHHSRDGAYQAEAWGATSGLRGTPDAIAGIALSPVHGLQRADDGIAFDPTMRTMDGTALGLSFGKLGRGLSRFRTEYRRISAGFDVNEMGFATVSGVQNAFAEVGIDANNAGRLGALAYNRLTITLRAASAWTTDPSPLALERAITLGASALLRNLAQVLVIASTGLHGTWCTLSCTRGGPAVVDPPGQLVSFDFAGDGRRRIVPHARLNLERDDEGRTRRVSGQLDAVVRLRSNVDASIAVEAAHARTASQFFARFGAAASDTSHYTFAALDQGTRAFTARTNVTITPEVTVQAYTRAYVAGGAFGELMEIGDPRAMDWERRFRPYPDTAVSRHSGGVDFRRFQSNVVFRWEYRPGSAILLVWSQGRDWDTPAPRILSPWPGGDLRGLFATRPRNTVALKVSYWLDR